jgi:phosphoglucomutase
LYICLRQGVAVKEVPTKPIQGQKTGTSGLRKKTREFTSENYLANWVQSLFLALGDEVQGQTLGLGGDGRYFGKEAAQIIIKLAAGNGFKKVVVGQDAIMATPAMSALIRQRKLYGKHHPNSHVAGDQHAQAHPLLQVA